MKTNGEEGSRIKCGLRKERPEEGQDVVNGGAREIYEYRSGYWKRGRRRKKKKKKKRRRRKRRTRIRTRTREEEE